MLSVGLKLKSLDKPLGKPYCNCGMVLGFEAAELYVLALYPES